MRASIIPPPVLHSLGTREYERVWRDMQRFTDTRDAGTPDEIWFVEHPRVFTLGLGAKEGNVLDAGDVPVVRIDRGGDVTYHGPGQLVTYVLLDLRRLKLGVRDLVIALEGAVIDCIDQWGVRAHARREAPGVYVGEKKLASVGLRIRRGCSYHGVAINVSNDTAPFRRIHVCGYQGLEVTRLADLGGASSVAQLQAALTPHLLRRLGFDAA